MKVSELIINLKNLNQDSEVILQKDAEGNGYSPLSVIDGDAVYIPDSTWSGDVYDMTWSAGDACMDDDEWRGVQAMPRCVILAPVN